VLITRRKADATLPGLWEFPGGKLEPHESPRQAVVREMREEVALEVTVLATLEPLRHRYADFEVVLHPFVCKVAGGEARPLASQELRWATLEEIEALPMPDANATLLPRVAAALRSMPLDV
jgi:mutator protein MutT